MSETYVIGIDIGTQGTKAALYTADGRKKAESFERSRLICPAPGEVCQDPAELYGSVVRTIKNVMDQSGVTPNAVAAMAMDAQMAGILAVDRQFEAVGMYDSWLDTKSARFAARIKQQAEEEIIKKTGGQAAGGHGARILRRKWEKPEEYNRIAKFVLPGVYVAGRLCGLSADDCYVDDTHLHFSGFADNRLRKWDQGLLQEFGIKESKLRRIVSPSEVIGRLTKSAALECGLSEGLLVAAGCGDSAASALGAGITEINQIYDVAGTASIFACSTDRFTPDVRHKTILFARSVIEGLYTPLAYIGGGGLCVKWFADQHGKGYEFWNREAEKVPAGSDGLYFIPHFSGRTCPGDDKVTGAYWGLSFYHGGGHMYRSILESIAYEYNYYYSIMKEQNPQISPEAIYGAGGGAKSSVWNQIKADALGICYRPLREADTAVYASAMLAAYAAGLITDLASAMKVRCSEERFEPKREHRDRYRSCTDTYVKLVEWMSAFQQKEKERITT